MKKQLKILLKAKVEAEGVCFSPPHKAVLKAAVSSAGSG